MNAEYRKLCPESWRASGPFQGWLKRYKEHLVRDHNPYLDAIENQKPAQLKLVDLPAEGFRSSVTLETVVDYMKTAQKIFGERLAEPYHPY